MAWIQNWEKLFTHKLQLFHALNPDDKLKRSNFPVDLLNAYELEHNFIKRIIFSDEETFTFLVV